jgi:hypothetical protein
MESPVVLAGRLTAHEPRRSGARASSPALRVKISNTSRRIQTLKADKMSARRFMDRIAAREAVPPGKAPVKILVAFWTTWVKFTQLFS